jgi:tRNA acetyltransferase TAN1
MIEPGDSGIWITCNKGREGKCTGEIRDLFSEYAEQLYPTASGIMSGEDEDTEPADIESEINAEVDHIRKSKTAQLFTTSRVDVQCGMSGCVIMPLQDYADHLTRRSRFHPDLCARRTSIVRQEDLRRCYGQS